MDKLRCGFCQKEFDIDIPVSVIIDHLITRHRKRTLAEFCFLDAFIKVHSVGSESE